jgi:hypothetical protein
MSSPAVKIPAIDLKIRQNSESKSYKMMSGGMKNEQIVDKCSRCDAADCTDALDAL